MPMDAGEKRIYETERAKKSQRKRVFSKEVETEMY
jgi:hypothetical protein